jgi:hypothetical protein
MPGHGLRCRCCCISGCSLRPRIERRIDITKINRYNADRADKLPHHIKIVAVVEFVHGICRVNVALSKYQGKTLILPVLFGIKVFEGVGELTKG